MPSRDDITHQQTLLSTYRRNLGYYLKQQAALGEAYAPPGVLNGIMEARSNIQRIKQVLRGWGVAVEDLPDDGDESAQPESSGSSQTTVAKAEKIDRARLRQLLIEHFSEEELRDLAYFDLSIDYETLTGTGKGGKVRELIAYAERHNRMQDLVEAAKRLRPTVSW